MTEQNKNISELIKFNLERARKIMNDKVEAISLIENALFEISAALGGKLDFPSVDEIDNDGDLITSVFVVNNISGYKEKLFWYYFHPEKVFPAMISYQNIVAARCDGMNEVVIFLENLISNDSFMIKILRISEMNELPHDDPPF